MEDPEGVAKVEAVNVETEMEIVRDAESHLEVGEEAAGHLETGTVKDMTGAAATTTNFRAWVEARDSVGDAVSVIEAIETAMTKTGGRSSGQCR